MKKLFVLLMTVLVFSFSAWCQKTIPVFTTINELFTTKVTSVNDAKQILIKHKLATDESCVITNSEYSASAKILRSKTYNEDYGTIWVEVTYDYNEYPSNFSGVLFMIEKNYINVFKSYLKKNNYKLLGEKPDFPWTQYYEGKYSCGITNMPDNGLSVMFAR